MITLARHLSGGVPRPALHKPLLSTSVPRTMAVAHTIAPPRTLLLLACATMALIALPAGAVAREAALSAFPPLPTPPMGFSTWQLFPGSHWGQGPSHYNAVDEATCKAQADAMVVRCRPTPRRGMANAQRHTNARPPSMPSALARGASGARNRVRTHTFAAGNGTPEEEAPARPHVNLPRLPAECGSL